jgi:hypothetical protein
MSSVFALAAVLLLTIPLSCSAPDEASMSHARDILSQEKAKAESIQNTLAGLIQSSPPNITQAKALLIARQEEIARNIARATDDQGLHRYDRQRIVDALASESAKLRDQVILLVKASELAPSN